MIEIESVLVFPRRLWVDEISTVHFSPCERNGSGNAACVLTFSSAAGVKPSPSTAD